MSNQVRFFGHPSSWLVLGFINLLQAINGSRYLVFPICTDTNYFSHLQLNNFLVASEFGKLFGFLSGAAADYVPASMILLIGLIFGLIGYGGQYLLIANKINFLTYWQVLLLNIIAGNSTCWISTYCYVLAIRNFRDFHSTIIAISSSYSALCARIYTVLVEGIHGRKSARNPGTYLFLTCFLPSTSGLAISVMSCGVKFMDCGGFDMSPVAFLIAISTMIYFVIEGVVDMSAELRAVFLGLVLILPFIIAVIITGLQQLKVLKCKCEVMLGIGGELVEVVKEVEIEMDKEWEIVDRKIKKEVKEFKREEMLMESGLKEEMMKVDLWLFYLVNMFGATLGLVYMVNLERISKSVNIGSSFLLEISCAFSFFGRIFPVLLNWFTRKKSRMSNSALTVVLMVPMPVAFYLLINEPNKTCLLYISTGILGTCSGALTAITATTIYQLFGRKSFVAKQTLILTNIPFGFLLFGWLSTVNYDKLCQDFGICKFAPYCFNGTFIIWGSFSFLGTILSLLLYLRTHFFKFS